MKRRNFIKISALATAGFSVLGSINPFKAKAETLVDAAGFTLPKLPYSYGALEPFVDELTMTIHHSKHHAAYVTNLNKALETVVGKHSDLEQILANVSTFNSAVRNNAGGHYNHSFFWKLMTPKGSEMGALVNKALSDSFGSVEQFKAEFRKTALTVFGSGWAWVVQGEDGKLKLGTTPNQDNPLMDVCALKGKPVLALDVWEHAYYLKHQNKRADYIDGWWQIVNWKQVEENLNKA